MSVAEAVQADFKLPAKIEKAVGFERLLTAKPDDLPEDARKKQLELFEFVDGTSQRSWLDKLKPKKPLGGHRPRKDGAADPTDEDPNAAANAAIDLWKPIIRNLQLEGLTEKSWADLPRDHLLNLKGIITDLNRELGKVKID